MARAFLASVPLTLVLIAAVVVPVALTPGTFGFHTWPISRVPGTFDRPPVVPIADSQGPPEPAASHAARTAQEVAAAGVGVPAHGLPAVRPKTSVPARSVAAVSRRSQPSPVARALLPPISNANPQPAAALQPSQGGNAGDDPAGPASGGGRHLQAAGTFAAPARMRMTASATPSASSPDARARSSAGGNSQGGGGNSQGGGG